MMNDTAVQSNLALANKPFSEKQPRKSFRDFGTFKQRLKKANINDESMKFDQLSAGINYNCKFIGLQEVKELRGKLICQEALLSLKAKLKTDHAHKLKVLFKISLVGITIFDSKNKTLIHKHPVNRISFVSKDSKDNKCFGYIVSLEDKTIKYFAFKAEKSAEAVVTSIHDLFMIIKELKTKSSSNNNSHNKSNGGQLLLNKDFSSMESSAQFVKKREVEIKIPDELISLSEHFTTQNNILPKYPPKSHTNEDLTFSPPTSNSTVSLHLKGNNSSYRSLAKITEHNFTSHGSFNNNIDNNHYDNGSISRARPRPRGSFGLSSSSSNSNTATSTITTTIIATKTTVTNSINKHHPIGTNIPKWQNMVPPGGLFEENQSFYRSKNRDVEKGHFMGGRENLNHDDEDEKYNNDEDVLNTINSFGEDSFARDGFVDTVFDDIDTTTYNNNHQPSTYYHHHQMVSSAFQSKADDSLPTTQPSSPLPPPPSSMPPQLNLTPPQVLNDSSLTEYSSLPPPAVPPPPLPNIISGYELADNNYHHLAPPNLITTSHNPPPPLPPRPSGRKGGKEISQLLSAGPDWINFSSTDHTHQINGGMSSTFKNTVSATNNTVEPFDSDGLINDQFGSLSSLGSYDEAFAPTVIKNEENTLYDLPKDSRALLDASEPVMEIQNNIGKLGNTDDESSVSSLPSSVEFNED